MLGKARFGQYLKDTDSSLFDLFYEFTLHTRIFMSERGMKK